MAGDPTRLRQVMTNLVSNALKFTPPAGAVKLQVTSKLLTLDRTEIEIAVIDTGIGMSEAQVAGLFQAFAQADVSTTRKFGGTGLGLAICRQLVDLMGGEITATSRPDAGSTFRVSVPLDLAEPASLRPSAGATASRAAGCWSWTTIRSTWPWPRPFWRRRAPT